MAATLRASLVAGADCPVCAQAVATVPAVSSPAADIDADADADVTAAEQAYERATAAEAAAVAAIARAEAEPARLAALADRLRAGLAEAGIASADALAAAAAELDRAAAEQQRAATALRAARTDLATAAAALEDVRDASGRAGAALAAARDPLVPLGAPSTGDDPFSGWAVLLAWAPEAAAERESELVAAEAAAGAAEQERRTAEAALRGAEHATRDRRAAETAAARAEQEAHAAVTSIERRAAALRVALETAPACDAAAAALVRVTAAEQAAEVADAAVRTARREQRVADTAAADVDRAVTGGWRVLRAARDPLVALDVPVLDPVSDDGADAAAELPDAWAALLHWAAAAREERSAQLTAAEQAATDATARVAATAVRFAEYLAEHGVGYAEPARAATAVAAEAARASAAHERIVERRATVAGLVADRDRADEAHRVAKMLGGLLRSDGFPRWLVASALDALVTDASASLAELSGGQFELTHDHGEFLVVDHADADSRRPVKTLSGGETFQASLALALALSAQMSNLAASGAVRLESIFLDEGFGTLDETNLDIVASTLERLAAGGDRMVGVITHVPALAERVPVRFVVRRDQRTSSIVRESL
ncbi:MAG: SMC family ATPase [Pseudonocardia sp.]|nr:SMC family ATPase [Pseudonocardia sp.]